MYSVRRGQVDAVRRSGGAFSLSQQLRGAGKLRAALEADLSFAANRNAAHAFRFLINLIFHYSWPEHVERFKAEALAQKQEELRARFRQVSNVVLQKALVAAVLFLYGSRLCREAVYVLCGKQGTSGDSCSGDKPPFLPNLALPCAPLGSEAVFESSGTAEGR